MGMIYHVESFEIILSIDTTIPRVRIYLKKGRRGAKHELQHILKKKKNLNNAST